MSARYDRRTMLALASAASLIPAAATARDTPTGAIGDFDFQEGRWRVAHRSRMDAASPWRDFAGTVSMRKILGGQGNLEEHEWRRDGIAYHAIGLRTFDPASATWSIFWLDSRWPGAIGSPVVGGFEGKRGEFYSDDVIDGRRIRARFVWLVDDPNHCRWEQASSLDNGVSWETNWEMRFTRIA